MLLSLETFRLEMQENTFVRQEAVPWMMMGKLLWIPLFVTSTSDVRDSVSCNIHVMEE